MKQPGNENELTSSPLSTWNSSGNTLFLESHQHTFTPVSWALGNAARSRSNPTMQRIPRIPGPSLASADNSARAVSALIPNPLLTGRLGDGRGSRPERHAHCRNYHTDRGAAGHGLPDREE